MISIGDDSALFHEAKNDSCLSQNDCGLFHSRGFLKDLHRNITFLCYSPYHTTASQLTSISYEVHCLARQKQRLLLR